MTKAELARWVVSWGIVAGVFGASDAVTAATTTPWGAALVFAGLLAVIVWAAFGVVEEADVLAERLGEPYGTLVLTLAIVVIEVALIGAVMLGAADPTLGRDTMFAVLMIVLNGVVGLGLLIGGARYGTQAYNLEGAGAYLAVIMPLTVIALVLPNFTTSTAVGTLSSGQSIAFAAFTLLLYGTFIGLQTGRHRDFFVMPDGRGEADGHAVHAQGSIAGRVIRLLVTLLPVVLLAKPLAKVLDKVIHAAGAPPALGGVLIALIVFTPEGLAALRAVSVNRMQRAINLCLGAAASTIGLTVPALLLIGVVTGQNIVLGLSSAHMVILALTLILSTLTFSGPRTNALNGAMHLVVFFVYITLIFSP